MRPVRHVETRSAVGACRSARWEYDAILSRDLVAESRANTARGLEHPGKQLGEPVACLAIASVTGERRVACRQQLSSPAERKTAMARTDVEIRSIRDYFEQKLQATKQRNDVVKAIEHGPYDFVLLDTRARDAFAFGHITGAWCAPLEELDKIMPGLPVDQEFVTYCWGHD